MLSTFGCQLYNYKGYKRDDHGPDHHGRSAQPGLVLSWPMSDVKSPDQWNLTNSIRVKVMCVSRTVKTHSMILHT